MLLYYNACLLDLYIQAGYLYFPGPGPGPGPRSQPWPWPAVPAPNLFFTALALNFFLPASVLNSCLSVLRLTVKVCFSNSVYLDKLSLYLYLLTC